MARHVGRASDFALDARHEKGVKLVPRKPSGGGITFHTLTSAPAYSVGRNVSSFELAHQPGVLGREGAVRATEIGVTPWTGPDYLALTQECMELIANEVDPALVVLDMVFAPAREATRKLNRTHAVVSPNIVAHMFLPLQPGAGALWKFPM
jgi:hypothetical protein